MLAEVQMLADAGLDTRRRTGAVRDEALTPVAWRAFGGDVQAFVALSPRAQYALGRVEDEAREQKVAHTWATFRPRFTTAMRATRGLRPAYDEAGQLARPGRPRMNFDGGISSSADRHTSFLDADDSDDGAELMLAREAAAAVELRLEAAREAEAEAPAKPIKPRSVPMTAGLRAFRAHVEEQINRGHVPQWRSWALRILNLRGAWGYGCCDDDPLGELDEATPRLPLHVRELLGRVELQMSRPAPKKAGVAKAWVTHARRIGWLSPRTRAGLAREDEAKALTTRLFGLLGIECQKGSSAEQKRHARSAEAREFKATLAQAGDAYEAGDTSGALALGLAPANARRIALHACGQNVLAPSLTCASSSSRLSLHSTSPSTSRPLTPSSTPQPLPKAP